MAGVLNGVTYTLQTHEITVKVTDSKTGQLKAKVLVGGNEKQMDANGKADALFFRNLYKAVAPTVPSDPVPGGAAPVPTSQIIYNQAIIDGIFRSSESGHEVEIVIPEY